MLLNSVLLASCFVSAFITCALGTFVYAKNSSSPVNRLFFALMLGATYWAAGEFLIWQSGTAEGVTLWLKTSAFWPFVIALTVHFTLTFTGHPLSLRKYRPVLLAVLYIPTILCALAGLLTGTIYRVGYVPGTGYVYLPALGSPAFIVQTIYIVVIMLFAEFISISAWLRAPSGRARLQFGLMSAGLATVIGCGFITRAILPPIGIYTPNLVFIGIVIFSLLIAVAILKYGLFTVTPETAVPDILRLMPDGCILVDRDGRILSTNASAGAILGVAESTLPGRDIGEFIPETARKSIFSTIQERGSLPDFEVTFDHPLQRVVSIAGSQVHDPEGESAGLVLIIRDITRRKEAEREITLAHEKISLLTRLTRHDIGNIVTALWGYLELLKDNRTGPASDTYLAQSIGLVEKISDHLRFSREMQEACAYTPVWQPLAGMMEQAISEVPHEGVVITTAIVPVEILADPLAVRVIYNLLENAVRHGERLTEISVTTKEHPGGRLLVTIADDGVGIPDEDKEQIFESGYGRHTGFGLALSRDILSLTGIRIRETGTVGQGARFEILVPKGAWRPVSERY